MWAVRELALVRYFSEQLAAAARSGFHIRIHLTASATADDEEEAERDELSRLRDAGVVIENQRPDMPSTLRSADEVCAARGLQECAVLSCGPDALLAGLKEAIAETMTTTAFECHEETFDF